LGCGAYHEEDIKHLNMKYPKIVPSLKYYDDDRNEYETNGETNSGKTYYDPSDEIYGDEKICNLIHNANICIA
jgi:hypothetical protein